MKDLEFDNSFLRELPADEEERNFRRQVRGACYSRVLPTPVESPELVAHSAEVAEMLGLPEDAHESQDFVQIFAGNKLATGMETYATCYGGHQFGNWAGQLGDGRAINLGELVAPDGKSWELQLKGAGPTPYSRQGDGRAVLRSSIREFICSEAMHHLGVPTTRALSLVLTGEPVMRDMFYDGNAKMEPGAVVCRVAPTFLRFGNFQLFASRGDVENLRILTDYTIRHHFPHLGEPSPKTYLRFFEEVCCRTADLMVEWMRVGFVHGVMNTDNMSVLGLTIDYGPYGWLEPYDPNWTPNTTDRVRRRYRFGNQPQVSYWNLAQFGFALSPLFDGEPELMEETLGIYQDRFVSKWSEMMAAKLGFDKYDADSDAELIDELLVMLELTETDMTIFYRKLADLPVDSTNSYGQELSDDELIEPLFEAYYDPQGLEEQKAQIGAWLRKYAGRLATSEKGEDSAKARRAAMNNVNPKYVFRNYLAQLAIDKSEEGDHSGVVELLDVLRRPYEEQPGREQYADRRPEWARNRPGCSMLSCSS